MKNKFLSALLVGATMLASMSLFVSCKDYEDEINQNRNDISALQTQVTTLSGALDDAKRDAATAHSNLQKAIDDLNTVAGTHATKTALADTAKALRNVAATVAKEAAATAKAEAIEEAVKQAKSYTDQVAAGKADKAKFDSLCLHVAGIDVTLLELADADKLLSDRITADSIVTAQLRLEVNALNAFQKKMEEEVIPGLNAAIAANAKGIVDTAAAIRGSIAALAKTVEQQGKDIEQLKKDVNALDARLVSCEANIAILTAYVKRALTSLVFKPTFYVGGIEGVEIPTIVAYPLWSFTNELGVDKNGKYAFEVASNSATGAKTKSISGKGLADYHVNPANVDLDGNEIHFYTNTPVTRDGVDDIFVPIDSKITKTADYVKNGILTVPFQVDAAKLAKLDEDELPMMALQLQRGDTTVTSDYGLVLTAKYDSLIVADKKFLKAGVPHADDIETPNSGHLHMIFEELAADSIPATHAVAYDSQIDLLALVETHANYHYMLNGAEVVNHDVTMTEETFKNFGFVYRFYPIDYAIGTNATSETQHIVVDPETGIARPVKVDAEGKRTNEQAGEAAVGRKPIIRVNVEDAEGNVYAYGYIKLLIDYTDEPQDPDLVQPFTFNDDLFVNCGDSLSVQLYWNDIEYYLYDQLLGISKENFEKRYAIDTDPSDINQFVKNSSGGYTLATAAQKIGIVAEKADTGAAATNVLVWTIAQDDLISYFIDPATGLPRPTLVAEDGTNKNPLTTVVRFISITGTSLYIELSIPAGQIHFLVGAMDDNAKIPASWYALNKKEEGNKEIYANVVVPGTQTNDDAFVFDMLSTFKFGNLGSIVSNATLADFDITADSIATDLTFTVPVKGINAEFSADNAGKWKVKGQSGAEYTLQVAPDGKSVVSGDSTIVVLDPTDSTIVKFQDNEWAKDILNYAGHKEVASLETFTAYLKLTAGLSCYDINLGNTGYFNVKFLRPVDLLPSKDAELEDAIDNGDTAKLADLVEDLVDWRDLKFSEHLNYYKYYGVIAIVPDTTNIRTDIDLPKAERLANDEKDLTAAEIDKLSILSEVAPQVTFNLVVDTPYATKADIPDGSDETKIPDYGYLIYKNNSGNVQKYHIYVPLAITYDWGTQTQVVWSRITVNKTLNN